MDGDERDRRPGLAEPADYAGSVEESVYVGNDFFEAASDFNGLSGSSRARADFSCRRDSNRLLELGPHKCKRSLNRGIKANSIHGVPSFGTTHACRCRGSRAECEAILWLIWPELDHIRICSCSDLASVDVALVVAVRQPCCDFPQITGPNWRTALRTIGLWARVLPFTQTNFMRHPSMHDPRI